MDEQVFRAAPARLVALGEIAYVAGKVLV